MKEKEEEEREKERETSLQDITKWNRTYPNIWYAITPSAASLTRLVRSIRKEEYNFAESCCGKKTNHSVQEQAKWRIVQHKYQETTEVSPNAMRSFYYLPRQFQIEAVQEYRYWDILFQIPKNL